MTLCSLETFDQRKILRHLSYVCLSIKVKSVNWGLEHMERPIHTKFDI